MKKQILFLPLVLALLAYTALAAADGTYTWPMGTDKDITTHYTDDLTGMTHGALDFLAPPGSPVYATADGVVTEVHDEACLGSHFQGTTPANPCPLGDACQAVVRQGANGGYGNYVVISHGNGVTVLYGQLQSGSIHLEAGQTVSQGEQIALSGVSGNAYRPHLHFEMRRDGNTIDPEPLLTRAKPDPVNHSPLIELEAASSPAPGQFSVTGWAYDPDDLSAAVSVHVYISNTGNSTGTLIGTVTADESRPDVDARYHCGAQHGFSATFSTTFSGSCAIRTEAVNLGEAGGNVWTDTPLFVTIDSTADTEKPVISGDVRVEYLSPKGYTVTVPASDNVGVASVRMPSWVGSDSGSAEWYSAVRFGGEWSYAIDRNGEKEVWHTDVRVYDEAGNQAPLISIYIRYLTLTLDPAGGSLDATQTPVFNVFYLTDYHDQKYIGLYGDLPEPVRDGYIFEGWYTAASGGRRVAASTKVSAESDHTLYAHWVRSDQSAPEIRSVSISGISMSGYTVTVEAVDDIGVTSVKMPSWVGSYTASTPWFDAQQSGDAWSAAISRAGEPGVWHTEAHVYDDAGNEAPLVSVYLRQLSVTFNPNGGSSSVLSKTVFNAFYLVNYRNQTYCAAYGNLPVPERPGYTFTGWYTAVSGGSRVTEDTPVRSETSHTLYARWKAGSSVQPTPGQLTPSPIPDDPADTTARIVVGSVTARPGGSAQVTISLRNNPGIVSMMLRLSYDRSVLTLTNVEDGRLLGQYEGSRSDYSAMPYVLSWSDDTATVNRTANGAIATLTFAVSAQAAEREYPVQVSYDNSRDEIFNADFRTVSFAVTQGAVRVSSGTAGDVNRDGHVTAIDRTVLARHLAGWNGYGSADIDMSAADVNADGRVTAMDRTVLARHLAGWSGYETLPYTTRASLLSFRSSGGASGSGVSADTAEARAFLEGDNTPRIRVGSAAVGQGGTAAVTISLENNPGVISMELLVDYPDALELTDVRDGGLFGDSAHNPDYGRNPYILSWNDDLDRQNYTGNGTLATLYFRLKDGAQPGTYAIGVHYNQELDAIYDFEMRPVEFAVAGGSVRFGDSVASPSVGAPVFSGNDGSMYVSMHVSGAPAGAALSCAVYDGAGRLLSCTSRAVQGDGDYAFPLPGTDAARVKGFLVDQNGKPLCVAATSA